jgi:hypothetical protein
MTLLSIKQQLMVICPHFHCPIRRVHSKLQLKVRPGFKYKISVFTCSNVAAKYRKILENKEEPVRDLSAA